MNRSDLLCAIIMTCGAGSTPLQSQSLSYVGEYLGGWGAWPGSAPASMSATGEWIAFVESDTVPCVGGVERISMIRPDGTGYRIVVDIPVLEDLEPDNETYIYELALDGEANQILFYWPHKTSQCLDFAPVHWYLADTQTGAASEITFNGEVVGFVSITDDGQSMAFKGYDPATGKWGFYRSAPDGSGAVLFHDASPWFAAGGRLSGDGTKFVFFASSAQICPCGTDFYAYDFETGVTTKLNRDLLSGFAGLQASFDGERIVLAASATFGVAADGTNFHVLAPTGGTAVTITRDGKFVIYAAAANSLHRVSWGGGPILDLGAGAGSGGPQPANWDGTVVAVRDKDYLVNLNVPLAVWFEKSPVLTTWGFGLPGTELTWDVGGKPGDSFLLAYALAPASVPFKGWGVLGLDPATLQVFAGGTVAGPNNVGQVRITLPMDLGLTAPVPVWFQAAVSSAAGTRLTNVTQFTLGDSASAMAAPPPTTVLGGGPRHDSHHSLPFEQRMRLEDPAVWMAERDAGLVTAVRMER